MLGYLVLENPIGWVLDGRTHDELFFGAGALFESPPPVSWAGVRQGQGSDSQ
jgi:hypothetical protein